MFNVDMKKNGGWLLQLLDNKTKYEAVPGKRRDLPRGGGKRDVDSFDSHKLTSSQARSPHVTSHNATSVSITENSSSE